MASGSYIFDAYGTLFDVHAAVRRSSAALGPLGQRLSEVWRGKQLEYAWVRALMGRYRDFWALTEEALDHAIAVVAPDQAAMKPALLEAYRRLDAFPEVPSVLRRLKAKGARLAILSNGSPDMLASAIASAGIKELVDTVVSVDPARTYKTDARIYELAVAALGAERPSILFLSSNRWDIAGAVACGLRSIWVNRTGQPDEYGDLKPFAVVSSLEGLDA